MGHFPGGQQPQGGGVAQAVVRPQGGAAVAAQEAVPLQDDRRLGQGVKAIPGGAHHVHVALEDEPGPPLPARRGGQGAEQVARPVDCRRGPQPFPEEGGVVLPGGPLPVGGVGMAGEGPEGVRHPPENGRPAPQPVCQRHGTDLLLGR